MSFKIDSFTPSDNKLLLSINIGDLLYFDNLGVGSIFEDFESETNKIKLATGTLRDFFYSEDYSSSKNDAIKYTRGLEEAIDELFVWCKSTHDKFKIEKLYMTENKALGVIETLLTEIKEGVDDIANLDRIKAVLNEYLTAYKDSLVKHAAFLKNLNHIKTNPIDVELTFFADSNNGYSYELEVLKFISETDESTKGMITNWKDMLSREVSKHIDLEFENSRESKEKFKNAIRTHGGSYQYILENFNPVQFFELKREIELYWFEIFEDQSSLCHYITKSSSFYKGAETLVKEKLVKTQKDIYKIANAIHEKYPTVSVESIFQNTPISKLLKGEIVNTSKLENTRFTHDLSHLESLSSARFESNFEAICKDQTKLFGGKFLTKLNSRVKMGREAKLQLYSMKDKRFKSDNLKEIKSQYRLPRIKKGTKQFKSFETTIRMNGSEYLISDIFSILNFNQESQF